MSASFKHPLITFDNFNKMVGELKKITHNLAINPAHLKLHNKKHIKIREIGLNWK